MTSRGWALFCTQAGGVGVGALGVQGLCGVGYGDWVLFGGVGLGWSVGGLAG